MRYLPAATMLALVLFTGFLPVSWAQGQQCAPQAEVHIEAASGTCVFNTVEIVDAQNLTVASSAVRIRALCPALGLTFEEAQQVSSVLQKELDPRFTPPRFYAVSGGAAREAELLQEAQSRKSSLCACWYIEDVKRHGGFVSYSEMFRSECSYTDTCQINPPLTCAKHIGVEEAYEDLSFQISIPAYALPVMILTILIYLVLHTIVHYRPRKLRLEREK